MPLFLNDTIRKPSEIRTQIAELTESRRSWEIRQRDLPRYLRSAEDAERQFRDQRDALRAEQSRLRALPKASLAIGADGQPYDSVGVDVVARFEQCEHQIRQLDAAYTDWVNAPEAQRVGGDRFGHQIVWSIRRPSDLREQLEVARLAHGACSRAIEQAERELAAVLEDR